MRRVIVCFAAVCSAAVLVAGAAPAKSSQGVMCVMHARLSAINETTGSTSIAKGHTLIKVRSDGTIEFKTHILNKNNETFVAGHIHQAPVGAAGPIVVPLFVAPTPTDDRSPHQAEWDRRPESGHDWRERLCEPECLLRQLPHDGVSRRRDSRPTALDVTF